MLTLKYNNCAFKLVMARGIISQTLICETPVCMWCAYESVLKLVSWKIRYGIPQKLTYKLFLMFVQSYKTRISRFLNIWEDIAPCRV